MSFFKKVGRPSEEEQMLISSIERMAGEKGVELDQLPDCQTLDDLIEAKSLLESYGESQQVQAEQADQNAEVEAGDETGGGQDQQEAEHTMTDEESVQNETIRQTTAPLSISKDEYDPFNQPVIERSYTGEQANGPASEDPAIDPTAYQDDDDLHLEDSKVESNLKDLSPATKRRAAEQTANTLLKGYARIAPLPFKWLSKISEEKVEKLTLNGELDPTLEVSEGLEFQEWMQQTNEQIDEIFKVEQDTLDEIREPLIEVLLEQQLELTPTQRLMMAIFSHLAQMLTVALNLRQQNNRILAFQKHNTALSRVKTAA